MKTKEKNRIGLLIIMLLSVLGFLTTCAKVDRVNPWDDKATLSPDEWAPENLTIEVVSITEKKLTWIYEDKNIEGFKLERRINNGVWESSFPIFKKESRFFNDTTVIPDTSFNYEYRLNAIAGNNESTQLSVSSKAVFPAPSDLKIVINNESKATITWTDNTNGEEGFRVEKKMNNENWQVLATVNKNIISYQDNSFSLITTVNYRVSAGAKQFFSSSSEDYISAPVIGTSEVDNVTVNSSHCGGMISGTNIPEITERGICYGMSQTPTIDGNHTSEGVGEGSFFSDLNGLEENTMYYYRAYTKTIAGTFYGDEKTFTTLPSPVIPTILTTPITNVGQNNATSGGYNIIDGGSSITSKGICWGMGILPTIADYHTNEGIGNASFVSNMQDLATNTIYYYRAYATNSQGVAYGDEFSFVTLGGADINLTDIDGNIYSSIVIGTQVWMGSNLRTTHFNNNDPIPNVTDNQQWAELNTSAFCWYNNDENANSNTYGALYNWFTVVDSRNLCPIGWHIPNDSDFTILENYLGNNNGGKLKEIGTLHWNTPNTDATNESLFLGMPGGFRDFDGTFYDLGNVNFLWSSTEFSGEAAWNRLISHSSGSIERHYLRKVSGLSVRCVKD